MKLVHCWQEGKRKKKYEKKRKKKKTRLKIQFISIIFLFFSETNSSIEKFPLDTNFGCSPIGLSLASYMSNFYYNNDDKQSLSPKFWVKKMVLCSTCFNLKRYKYYTFN